MISIFHTVGMLMVPCPKCGMGHFAEDWGMQKCIYEKCDGHEWDLQFTPEIAVVMLKEIESQAKRYAAWKEENATTTEWNPPRLQKTNDGWIVVPQPDKIVHIKSGKQIYP